MKKVLCVLGIIVLFSLIIMPPALRIFMKEDSQEEKIVVVESKSLYCSNPEYISNTVFEGNQVKMIIIKHIMNKDVETEEDSNNQNSGITNDDLVNIFERLKKESIVNYSELTDGEAITVDYSVSSNANLNIPDLIKDIGSVEKYYESQNLKCNVR